MKSAPSRPSRQQAGSLAWMNPIPRASAPTSWPSTILNPSRRPARGRVGIWMALGAVIAAYAAVDTVFNPLGMPADLDHSAALLLIGGLLMGVMIAQPILAAIVTVFWPTSDIVRVATGTTLAVLVVYGMTLGGLHRGGVPPSTVLAPAWMYLAFLIPLLALRWLRRWRIASPLTRSADHDHRFSVRMLLSIITLVCVLAAAGRWALAPITWPATTADWLAELGSTATFGVVAALAFAVIVPGIAWVLGVQERGRACAATVAGMLSMAVGLTCVEAADSRPAELPTIVMINSSLAVGGYGSILLALFVLRWCGYRLTRARVAARPKANQRLSAAMAVVRN